ncbi:MAG TPA: histidine phosphatase family protein [Verrucomicrobiae bacterium]|nr:histidine phosphatase family protein [Verrucomicrobiae bacterium]
MTTFLLIRHGETDAVGREIMGWRPGWHLNANGREQAKRLADRLAHRSLQAIYTSPLERAVETAAILAAPHELEPRQDADFAEVRFGQWEGVKIGELDQREDLRRYYQFRSGVRPPGGELLGEVQTRVVRKLQALAAVHDGAEVAVVSHGDALRSALAFYLGIPLDMILRFEISPASLSVLEVSEWGARLMSMNESAACV